MNICKNFRFRPIRRDSIGSESSSLAGSTVDSELTITNAPQDKSRSQVNIVKPPCHPSVRDHKADPSSRHRPSSYYDSSMLVPRSVLSSTGSASSYDNLDKTDSLLPAHGRDSRTGSDIGPNRVPHSPANSRPYRSEKNPQCTPSPFLRGGTSRTHGSPFRSDEDRQGFGPKLQLHGAPKESRTEGEKSEIPRFLEGVCRRRTAGGHAQVIPPHLVGVFDPSRVIPASSHVPHDATDRQHLTAAESVPTAGKTLESVHPYNSRETFGVKSGQVVPVSLPSSSSSKLSFAYPACNRKPVKVKGGKTRPLQSDSVELSSSESENTFSFRNINCGGNQVDSTRSKVSRAKFSARASNSIVNDGRNKAAPQNNDLSSVNDLFHYTVTKSGAGPPLGQTEKPDKCDVQTVKAKAMASSKASHSSTLMQDNLKCSSSLTSKYAPKWNSSPLSVGNPASSPKGSPKWEPPKLIKGGLKQNQISSPKGSPKLQKQKSSPGNSPKWQYSPLVRSGQSYETTASPKSSPKYERISTAKCSPKVERVSSAKTASLKYENTCSPKSSPKVERNSMAGRNPRSETLSSNSNVKAGLQLHSQNNFKWESPKASSLETAVSRMNDSGSHHTNVKTDGDNAEAFKTANVTRFSQLHSSSAGNQVTGCGTKLRSNKDKQKQAIGISQLPSSDATDDVLSVQRKLVSPCFRDTSVGEEVAENAFKSTEKQSLTEATTNQEDNHQETSAVAAHLKTDVSSEIFSAENSESPQKITFEVGFSTEKLVTMKDEIKTAASEHDVVSSVNVQNEKKTSQDSGSVEYATGQTAGAATLKLENSSEAQGDHCDSLETEHNFSHIKARFDVVPEDGPDGKLVHHSENGESGETEGSKTRSPFPQTKMFTEIQESIEVVTQPCGSRVGSASLSGVLVDASCITPVDLVSIQPIQGNEHNVPNEYSMVPLQSPLKHSKLTSESRSSENVNSSSQGKYISHVAAVVPNTTPFVADAINNNLTEIGDDICSKSKMEVSDAKEQTSSVSSASEEHCNQEVVVEAHSSTGKSEDKTNVNIVSLDAELAFPSPIEKAIFTVDKEVTFVSHSVASPEAKSSSLTALTTKTESRPNSTQDAEKSEKPQLVVPVSSQASPPTDVFVTLTLHPLDETSSAFQKHCTAASYGSPDKTTSDKTFVIPTCQPFSPPPNIVYSCQLLTADAVPIPVTVGKEGLAANETNLPRENVEDKFFSAKSCSESNEQIGKDVRGRTENMGKVRSSTSITNELHDRKRDRLTTELKLKIEDRNCQDTTTGHPDNGNAGDASACSPDISPVMAALDDALAVLTSSVIDANPPSAEISNRIDIPVERFKQDFVKQKNFEKAEKVTFKLHPEVNKVAGRSHTSASSLSKKKAKVSLKECASPAIASPGVVDATMDVVRQEIQTVESRRHQLVKEDSFNRPDSPMFHETLPLPKDSIIRRNREKCCESTSSSDNNGSPLTSPRLVPRSLRKCKRGHNADKSASLPASSEVPSYKTFAG